MVEPQAATAQDDTETEIELHALHVLEQPRTGGTSGERRTSLDRAHTMPVSSFDEGHKALQVRGREGGLATTSVVAHDLPR